MRRKDGGRGGVVLGGYLKLGLGLEFGLRSRGWEEIGGGIVVVLLLAEGLRGDGERLQRCRSRSSNREIIRRQILSRDEAVHQPLIERSIQSRKAPVLLPKPGITPIRQASIIRLQSALRREIEPLVRESRSRGRGEIKQVIERSTRRRCNRSMEPLSKHRVA